ncbi:hypothetical protein [Gemmatirosa kalamazoonensis]|uniref:hypothetical protein n=1 Tax=Gemmatirosa kalamazoonensis TaxID=861299 RepID=UPI00046CEFED|nr:hypothetical protein [Gemmatirosa kalamazoonensis]
MSFRSILIVLAGILAAIAGVSGLAAVVQFARADTNAGFSDADHANIRAGRWWAPLSRDYVPPPGALLSARGKRLRRSGWRWAAAAVIALALLFAIAPLIRRAGV